jgi:hypothetical protein
MLARLTGVIDFVQMIMMKKRLAPLAAMLLALASLEGDGRAQQPVPVSGCTIVWVTAPTPPGKMTPRRRPLDFSAASVLDLEFWVVLPTSSATSAPGIELKLFTPNGHLYQTLSAPFVAPVVAPVAPRAAAAAGPASPGRPPRFQTVTLRLPVAGTTIVNSSLYGAWTAEAYLAGVPSPCTKALGFQIRP